MSHDVDLTVNIGRAAFDQDLAVPRIVGSHIPDNGEIHLALDSRRKRTVCTSYGFDV